MVCCHFLLYGMFGGLKFVSRVYVWRQVMGGRSGVMAARSERWRRMVAVVGGRLRGMAAG